MVPFWHKELGTPVIQKLRLDVLDVDHSGRARCDVSDVSLQALAGACRCISRRVLIERTIMVVVRMLYPRNADGGWGVRDHHVVRGGSRFQSRGASEVRALDKSVVIVVVVVTAGLLVARARFIEVRALVATIAGGRGDAART